MKNICFILLVITLILFSCSKVNNDKPEPDGTVQYVNIGTDQIAYSTYGDGFPLLMCMGYSGAMDMWLPEVINRFSEHYKVIVFDYPGIGYSSTQDTSQTIAGLAESTYEFMKAINVDITHLMGWSMGTNVALKLLVNHPESIGKMVLYAGDCGDTVMIMPDEWVVKIMTTDTTTEAFLSILFPPDWLVNHPDPSEYLPEMEETTDWDVLVMQWKALENWYSPGGGVAEQLSTIQHDVLLITGDQDVATPTANSYKLKDSIPNASLVVLDNCGHGAMYQKPKEFANHILAFLNN